MIRRRHRRDAHLTVDEHGATSFGLGLLIKRMASQKV